MPLSPDDPPSVAGYPIRARLGEGGMGRVYLTFTPGGRPVALKIIRPDFARDAEFRRRFRHEVAAAQRVQGVFTAPVIDADPEAEIPWLATAYVAGPALHKAVNDHGPLPPRTVFRLLAGTAEALIAVHAAGLVHRDLKPGNVLLAEDGPVVIDFGIARAADATTLTSTGARLGSPAFMAPEQVHGRPADTATDVFALGHLGMYAATGRSAFGEGPSEALLYRIANQAPDLEGCPDVLRELIERCLAKEPGERPSPEEIAAQCRDQAEQADAGSPEPTTASWLPEPVRASLASYDVSGLRPAHHTAGERTGLPPEKEVDTRVDERGAAVPVAGAPAPYLRAPPGTASYETTPFNDTSYDERAYGTDSRRPSGRASGGLSTVAVVALIVAVAAVVLAGAVVGGLILTSGPSRTVQPGAVSPGQANRGDQAPDEGQESAPPDRQAPPPETHYPDRARPSAESAAPESMAPEQPVWITYTENGYTLSLPRDWSRRNEPPSVFWDAPGDITYLQVDSRPWDGPGTALGEAELASSRAAGNSGRFPGYQLIGVSELSYHDGDAADWEFTFNDPATGRALHGLDRFFRANGETYAMYLRATEEDWQYYSFLLEQIQATFQPD